jgi:hypothetical protein
MKSIWKYKVTLGDFIVEMPAGAHILSVQYQAATGTPQLWALVDPDQPSVQRQFTAVGTGFRQPDEVAAFQFVGTFQFPNALVFHLFDAGEK